MEASKNQAAIDALDRIMELELAVWSKQKGHPFEAA